ncbi:hypothetical protein FRACYDRAFT_233542 [Fragilariopsis cylindrus CCMP1102]|uniref:Uncharacterized protein n=1 Tax=Fragilariopsis cylindrus CCMP1102 TaxID=635003 RepID=A0A1E7FYY8_9STRA|nr:hypothetical protein FRACYDRAFT_233542 [Fragilariopsis cylindrus CCMP1102]|eukprot:OEU23369.1 hypothetical protein FRACYDRAFT_233542 [Fragilariopsis cylindrus CCMP1102]
MSDLAQIGTITLMNKLLSLKTTDFPTRHGFLISFQELTNRYDQIADKHLDDSFKKTLLQRFIMYDTALLNSWITVTENSRSCYTIQAANDDVIGDDDDCVLDGFLAHMSVSNEPMRADAVNALQVYSTFQQQRRRNNGPPRVRDPDSVEIPQPLYGELSRELRMVWSREPYDIKKRILNIKQQVPKQGAKKNVDLGVYMIESEGYESDASAYSEHTYDYDVDG